MQKRINGNEMKYSKNDAARDKTNKIGDLKQVHSHTHSGFGLTKPLINKLAGRWQHSGF